MNKALLDTDIFSELGKGVDPTVARHGATYRATFGRYTISVITVMEVVRGLQKMLSNGRTYPMTEFLKSSATRCSLSGVKRLAVPVLALALVLLSGFGVLAQTQKAGLLSEADLPPRVKALIEALRDEDASVRAQAAFNLGELGAKAESTIPALVKALIEALRDEDASVRGTAALSLAKVGAKAEGAVPALVKRVTDERYGTWFLYGSGWVSDKDSALAALKTLAPEKVEQALIDATKAKNPEVKRWAIDRLGKLDEGK